MRDLFGRRVSYKKRKIEILGCPACPQNHAPGINKVKGLTRIEQRRAMLWAQSPGKEENKQKLELVGPSGQLLWKALRTLGLARKHFDVQNVMRCWPHHEEDDTPTKEELRCCSVYNEDALEANAGRARVHLVLGEVAGKQLLGTAYRKSEPVFWHEPWNAYVVLNYHPAYLLRLGGEKSGWSYTNFCNRMRAVAAVRKHPGRYGYLNTLNYGAIYEDKEFEELERTLRSEAEAGRRISLDFEEGWVDGKYKLLTAGFGWGRYTGKRWHEWSGGARSVVFSHPEIGHDPNRIKSLTARLKRILSDVTIQKVMQHGSHDCDSAWELLRTRIKGYTFDTQYGTYLWYSHLRSYSLESIITNFLPEFLDYKKTLAQNAEGNFANVPLKRLVMYNCADCDVTKRSEELAKPHVNSELVRVYIHVAKTIDRMEKRGPWLDHEQHKRIGKALEPMIAKLERKLKNVAGDPEFNPATPEQVAWLLYDRLGLPDLAERSTQENALKEVQRKTKSPVPQLVMDIRGLYNIRSTFWRGYKNSADRNNGQLRTIWWLTGAATGRLRSGRGGKAEVEGIVNFQNLHGNPIVNNMLVSDPNWREAVE